jgi:hypothetical protein
VTAFRTNPGPPSLAFPSLLLVLPLVAACGPAEGEHQGVRRAASYDVPASAEERSLQAPPDLQVGEWWAMDVMPELVSGPIRTTIVVTDRSDHRATLGIPPEEFSDDFLIIHIPPLGDLELSTFAWRVMWDDFEALRFPLEEGRTWFADFHGRDVEAEVTRVEGNRAYVTMTGENQRIELTYDADLGMISEFREQALRLGFRVVDHGFGYAGPVARRSGIRLGMMESPAGATAHHHLEGRGVGSTAHVDTGVSHGSLGLILWNVGYEDEPGDYRIAATAPDGTRFEETFRLSGDAPSVDLATFPIEGVDGAWEVEFERDGPAGLLVELFTYDLSEVQMGGGG